MPIDVRADYAADPDRVLALLTEEQFLRDYVAALGARLLEVEATPHRTTVRMLAPTVGIPAVFSRFVGREVAVTDTRTWTPDGTGGHTGAIEVRAEIFGRTALVRAHRTLTAVDGGSRSLITGDAQVDAPLVGRQAEAAVRELATVVLRREDDVLARRLSGRPRT